MTWGTSIKDDIVYHDFSLQTPQQYIETNLQIEYGRAFHATTLAKGVTYATCSDVKCREMFAAKGLLDGTKDVNFRIVSKDWPVMALSYALGAITNTEQPLVFALGHARDPVVEYRGRNNVAEERSLFFHTSFDSTEDAVSAFPPQGGCFSPICPSSSLSSSRIIRTLSKQPMHSIANYNLTRPYTVVTTTRPWLWQHVRLWRKSK